MTEQPASDALPECREAFEKWYFDNWSHGETTAVHHAHKDGCWLAWLSSRSAFAAELVRRLEDERLSIEVRGRKGWLETDAKWNNAIDKAIAIIRQMAGEK